MVAVSVIAMAVGTGTAALLMAPVALGVMGFGAGGVAAGSTAAGMMSSAAVANGGGVAAGSLVAALQSAGAAGLTSVATVVVGKCRSGSRWSGGMGDVEVQGVTSTFSPIDAGVSSSL
ncbi:interferon alpha-inducible protein 27-like protein 2A [Coregonus clupeaformis]|uniref:interferon alpha-inducible protein 27-like protein 2A n=1 Tax=Coregonus clupeaformis TaxID=59861 RepID=UPI001E1C80B9|nr:interferon alpha-inducible protein 27-like protein 2A [Coregonus clupeaformis]